MHMHSSYEPGASMAMQMYNANLLGMKYIWFTEHDNRMGAKKNYASVFHFDNDTLIDTDADGINRYFNTACFKNNSSLIKSVDAKNQTLTLSAKAKNIDEWQSSGVFFISDKSRYSHSLFMDISLGFDLLSQNINKNSRLIFDVRLSQRPDKTMPAHILYVLGDCNGLSAPHTQIIPLKVQNGRIALPISNDVSNEAEIGGKDNVFDTITITLQVRNNAELTVKLKDFYICTGKEFEDVHQAQKLKAAELGAQYGITPFVSFEVSGAGGHKNCFSSNVPVIDYYKYNHLVSVYDAVKHIKNYGGIFSINHPFPKIGKHNKSERQKILKRVYEELLKNKAYGANLIEVGFPAGKHYFPFEDYLLLWDKLSSSGLFLCGYGDSDSHRGDNNWFEGNNFASYVGVDSTLKHPIAERHFTDAMAERRLFTANPLKIKGAIRFETQHGHQMGTIFDYKKTTEIPITFYAEVTDPEWTFRLIENGKVIHSQKIHSYNFTYNSVLKAKKTPVSFQRVEIYDAYGTCILLTNPIFIANHELL